MADHKFICQLRKEVVPTPLSTFNLSFVGQPCDKDPQLLCGDPTPVPLQLWPCSGPPLEHVLSSNVGWGGVGVDLLL